MSKIKTKFPAPEIYLGQSSDLAKSLELHIKNSLGQNIVGILERNETATKTTIKGAKVGIICHGLLGHKNYLFLENLAKTLSFDTFRFDFRGNGESDGELFYYSLQDDLVDISTVVEYLQKEFRYQIYAIIGHSKGALTALQYAAKVSPKIPHIINISARYDLSAIMKKYSKEELQEIEANGEIVSKIKLRGKVFDWKIKKEELQNYMAIPTYLVENIPDNISVFTIHGTTDELVPVNDAAIYANLISNHTLHLISGADHNYTKHSDEVIKIITEYFAPKSLSQQFIRKNRWLISKIPRNIYVDGVRNFRDLGGWRCLNLIDEPEEIYFRERFVFRSGNLSRISNSGIDTIQRLNIQKIIDFRSNPEIKMMGSKEIEGITRIHAPAFVEEDYSPEALFEKWNLYFEGPEGFSKAYMNILLEAKNAFRKVFEHILNDPASPLLIHCTAGKDRTGVACMLLLKLAGVDEETIAREYEITQSNMRKMNPKKLADTSNKFFIGKIMDSKYESMFLTLEAFNSKYGSVDTYLTQECNFTPSEVQQMKKNLVISRKSVCDASKL
ncbi:hypothetical protein G9A89_002120 [Geosiphon pyriformis]|nr:hypothetical protein G9A89_002120 [Geosiphon pyriformis]